MRPEGSPRAGSRTVPADHMAVHRDTSEGTAALQ